MSWWIKEHIAVNEDETKQLCSIEADNQTSLPAADQSATAGFIIVRGSDAKDVSTGDVYIMNSSGTWIVQPSGVQLDLTGYATTQELTDGLADKVDTTTYSTEQAAQNAEIGVVAAMGAKNLLYISNTPGYTATSHGRTFTVLSDGGIKITGESSDNSNADFYIIGSWGNRSILLNDNKDSCLVRMSCDTDYGYGQIRLRVMNRSTGSTVNETGVETNKDVLLSHVITTVFVSVFPSVTLPENGIVVYPMIRRAEIKDNTFVPYAPTNRELYEMILALQ